jgi:CHAD domain-containing protein
LHAVAPHLQASEQQNLELQNRLACEARARLDAAVECPVPNYREIDQDPRWHNWLRSVDPLSGRVRQTLLDEASASATPHLTIVRAIDVQRARSFRADEYVAIAIP